MSKKILDFYKKIGGMDTKESLEKYLLFTLSPVIGGLKPSSTITLSYDNKEFLNKLGYDLTLTLEENLDILVYRYEKYHCPHELGLFLGIPFEDVKDFMECTTKKCLLCGYWKVYNNSDEAKMIFNQYDEVKHYTIKNMLEGNSSRILVSSIKDSFYNNYICI